MEASIIIMLIHQIIAYALCEPLSDHCVACFPGCITDGCKLACQIGACSHGFWCGPALFCSTAGLTALRAALGTQLW